MSWCLIQSRRFFFFLERDELSGCSIPYRLTEINCATCRELELCGCSIPSQLVGTRLIDIFFCFGLSFLFFVD